jgi:hypothetical protein
MNAEKTCVSIAEMARMVGLSRARFYQLMGTTFPWPVYSVSTKRPFYDHMLQNCCLEVRRRNCGIDGKPVLFYSKRIGMPVKKPRKVKPIVGANLDILDGLRSLGLTTVTMPQVTTAVNDLFPRGVMEVAQDEVLRAVFLHLERQDRADNVRR